MRSVIATERRSLEIFSCGNVLPYLMVEGNYMGERTTFHRGSRFGRGFSVLDGR
jgi:hypothetical protein